MNKMQLIKTVQFADPGTHKGHQTLTPAAYDAETDSVYLGTWRRDHGGCYVAVSMIDYSVKLLAESEKGFYWSGACTEGSYVVFGSTSDGTDDVNTPSDGDVVIYAWSKIENELIQTVLHDSGSICTSVVENDGKYYFVSKSGKLYEAEVYNGRLNVVVKSQLSGKSTCTPFIYEEKAYIGFNSGVEVVDLATGEILERYNAPADVKGLIVVEDKIYCTYNNVPGGLYDVRHEKDFFVPYSSMQQYCISTIVMANDGTLYFSNDSNNVMAVRAGYIPVPKVAAQKKVTAELIGANSFRIKWSSQTIEGFDVKYKVSYQKSGGKWMVYKKAATGTDCKINDLVNGAKYRFRVTPYVLSGEKTYFGEAKMTGYTYTLKAPEKLQIKRNSTTSATIKWNKVNGATGYKIYRATKKNGKYICVKSVEGLSAKVTAKKGFKYYYKVRAYKRVGSTDIKGPLSTYKFYKFK